MPPVTVSVSDNTHYYALSRQLLTCLDTAPYGRDRPQMKNGRDDDRLAAVLVPLIWRVRLADFDDKTCGTFVASWWTDQFSGRGA